MKIMSATDVGDAVDQLRTLGYGRNLIATERGLVDRASGDVIPPERVVIDWTFRYEGISDPSDEALVLGVRDAHSGQRGTFVSHYGPDADPIASRLLEEIQQ